MHLTALLVMNFFIAPIPMDTTTNQGNAIVRGTVLDYTWNRTVAGAVVTATSPTTVAQTISDAHGNFFFLTLLPGNYTLSAWKLGLGPQCRGRHDDPAELDAGFEYSALIPMARACP